MNVCVSLDVAIPYFKNELHTNPSKCDQSQILQTGLGSTLDQSFGCDVDKLLTLWASTASAQNKGNISCLQGWVGE